MAIAMVIAHLLGDYVFQWNALARWKSHSILGVLAHGVVVFIITIATAVWVDVRWVGWAAVIGISHIGIDIAHYYFCSFHKASKNIPPLMRFILDQFSHAIVIAVVLWVSGYLSSISEPGYVSRSISFLRLSPMVFAAYLFVSMPAWILVEFIVFGLIKRSGPDFGQFRDKYIGILERTIIVTLILFGQLPLILFVPIPRLIADVPMVSKSGVSKLYLSRLLGSIVVAVLVGQAVVIFGFLN